MHPRTYSLTLTAAAASLFLGVVGTNLALDPQSVFGTGLLGSSPNYNNRYASLASYRAGPERFDGLLFGSSRAHAIPHDELSRRSGGVTFASFAVNFGSIADHLPVLEFVAKQKSARGRPLQKVFLLIDVDSLHIQPKTNKFIQTLLPPELTGESAARFWWKNATAIQIETWRSSIKSFLGKPSELKIRNWTRAFREGGAGLIAMVGATPANAQSLQQTPSSLRPTPAARERITESISFEVHWKLLQRFVALCRDYGIELIVATSPLNRADFADYGPEEFGGEIREAVARVSEIVPLWDFSDPKWLSDRPQLWRDAAHFHPEVGKLMLRRIFGEEMPPELKDFGRLVASPDPRHGVQLGAPTAQQ